jgi:hypothetical protein
MKMNKLLKKTFSGDRYALSINRALFCTFHCDNKAISVANNLNIVGLDYSIKAEADSDSVKLQEHLNEAFGVNKYNVEVKEDHTITFADLTITLFFCAIAIMTLMQLSK